MIIDINLDSNKSMILWMCMETSKHLTAAKAHQCGNTASANVV